MANFYKIDGAYFYAPEEKEPEYGYLTIKRENATTLSIIHDFSSSLDPLTVHNVDIEYSTEEGVWNHCTWEYVRGTQYVTTFSLNSDHIVKLRGNEGTLSTDSTDYYMIRDLDGGSILNVLTLSGDLTTLLRHSGNVQTLPDWCFFNLFYSNQDDLHCKHLVLPTKNVAPFAYGQMFARARLYEAPRILQKAVVKVHLEVCSIAAITLEDFLTLVMFLLGMTIQEHLLVRHV